MLACIAWSGGLDATCPPGETCSQDHSDIGALFSRQVATHTAYLHESPDAAYLQIFSDGLKGSNPDEPVCMGCLPDMRADLLGVQLGLT